MNRTYRNFAAGASLAVGLLVMIGAYEASGQPHTAATAIQHDVELNAFDVNTGFVSVPEISRIHIIAVEVDWTGAVQPIEVDFEKVKLLNKPIVIEVRFLGQLEQVDTRSVERALLQSLAYAKKHRIAVTALEVNYQGQSSSLEAFANLLADWRGRLLPAGMPLILDIFEPWIQSVAFKLIEPIGDEFVLQVDNMADPKSGLFNEDRYMQANHALSRRTSKPYYVRIHAGGMITYRGEKDILLGSEDYPPDAEVSRSMRARRIDAASSPADIDSLLKRIEKSSPNQFKGIAWVPRFGANQAPRWARGTWLALIQGSYKQPELDIELLETGSAYERVVSLTNQGTVDASVPNLITLGPGCFVRDSRGNYRDQQGDKDGNAVFQRRRISTISPGQSILVGHVQCIGEPLSSYSD